MAEKLVLLDVDNTLIDTNYKLNVSELMFKRVVERVQEKGLTVGLSSDSGLGTLAAIKRRFGLNGPIVAEKGAIVGTGGKTIRVNPETRVFAEIQKLFVWHAVERSLKNDMLLALGDVNWLSQALCASPRTDSTAPVAVLINTLRSASLSFFVRKNTDVQWAIEGRALDEIYAVVDKIGRQTVPGWWGDAVIDKNPDYGICIVHHPTTEKRNALPFLRNGHAEREIYMIGNSMSDWLDDSVTHYAVGNADSSFKARCVKVDSQPLTAGVVGLLLDIAGDS